MYGYKCDKCGVLIRIDPGEPRICDRCQERMEREERRPVRIEYREWDRGLCRVG